MKGRTDIPCLYLNLVYAIQRTEVDEENAAKDENYSRPWKIVLEDRFQVANSLLG